MIEAKSSYNSSCSFFSQPNASFITTSDYLFPSVLGKGHHFIYLITFFYFDLGKGHHFSFLITFSVFRPRKRASLLLSDYLFPFRPRKRASLLLSDYLFLLSNLGKGHHFSFLITCFCAFRPRKRAPLLTDIFHFLNCSYMNQYVMTFIPIDLFYHPLFGNEQSHAFSK